MTPIDWGAIVGVVPELAFALLFVIAFLELQKRWMAAQDKRDEMYERRNAALVEAITKMGIAVSKLNDDNLKHHTEMSAAVDEMRNKAKDLVSSVRSATRPLKKPPQ